MSPGPTHQPFYGLTAQPASPSYAQTAGWGLPHHLRHILGSGLSAFAHVLQVLPSSLLSSLSLNLLCSYFHFPLYFTRSIEQIDLTVSHFPPL